MSVERESSLSRGHVLLVDDDPLQLRSQSLHMRQAGYRVSAASTADEALRAARRDRPDVIVSDVLMPTTDGFRLCRAIRRDPLLQGVPVVLVSGHYGEAMDLRHAAHCGANMFVPRAHGPAALVRGVSETLRYPVRLDPLDDASLDAEHSDRLGHQLDRLAAEHEVTRQASQRDPLTGLLMRDGFKRCLDEALAMHADGATPVAALILSLTNFRELNDGLGPDCGDRILRTVSSRLLAAAGAGARCARLGGKEFGVLTTTGSPRDLEQVVETLQRAVSAPIVLDGVPVEMRSCVGAAVYPEDALLGSEVLRRASVSLHHARRERRAYARYSTADDPFSMEQLTLASELRLAIEREELEVWYQPKLDLATGAVDAVESLVRWRHPVRGLVPPDDFIPIAENTGLIHRITLHVLKQALAQARRWRDRGLALNVSVNVSQADLREPSFESSVLAALQAHGVPAGGLTLEITESAAMQDPARVVAALGALRRAGVRISLDDFGTGQASLAHLHNLPVDEIKLDKSFVLSLPDPRSRSIASMAAILAREFGLKSVAEGMESADVQALLARMGFGSVQGFHLSKPLTAPQLDAWLRERAAAGSGA